MSDKIKVGFCVAYDWSMLAYALPLVYDTADAICLSLDKDRRSWANNPFPFHDEGFYDLLKKVDVANKITLIEEDFHVVDLSPMQNEVRQRNIMAERMGKGGWHIQLDCDEYFIDFPRFVKHLKSISTNRAVNVCCIWVTLFKKIENGYLFIMPTENRNIEFIQVATNTPVYEYGRRNGHFNIYTNFKIAHQSWARTEEEVLQKLNNWGHKDDFSVGDYYKFWQSLSAHNYKTIKDFHPTQPECWPALEYIKAEDLEQFIRDFDSYQFQSLSEWNLLWKNSRVMNKLRSWMKRL